MVLAATPIQASSGLRRGFSTVAIEIDCIEYGAGTYELHVRCLVGIILLSMPNLQIR